MIGVSNIVRIKRFSLEKEFENILKTYPYLIDKTLVDGRVESQYKIVLSNGTTRYIDIIFFKKDEIVIIELKKDKVIKKNIQQLNEYVAHLKEIYPNQKIRGILVGRSLESNLEYSLNLRGLIFKKYFKDIPLELKICTKCRKAVSRSLEKCVWCGNQTFLKI